MQISNKLRYKSMNKSLLHAIRIKNALLILNVIEGGFTSLDINVMLFCQAYMAYEADTSVQQNVAWQGPNISWRLIK